ncbi:MAG: hypothetical protein GF384_07125 [Elusimicrobia bacterium]|nr:hypothetical protein [Elusimicrobiota bacterium]MBD3412444.1 hypothetical protein [Elusimicrobiota bacterium]
MDNIKLIIGMLCFMTIGCMRLCAEELHPRVYFKPEDIPAIKAKLEDNFFHRKYLSLRNYCEQRQYTNYTSAYMQEYDKSLDALHFALLAQLIEPSDPLYQVSVNQLKNILLHINDGLYPESVYSEYSNRWQWDGSTFVHAWYPGGVLMYYTLAYDVLVGLGELSGLDRTKVRSRILILNYNLYNKLKTWENLTANIRLRCLIGTGVVSMAFPDQTGTIPDPENLLNGSSVVLDTDECLQFTMRDLFVYQHSMPPDDNSGVGTVANFIMKDGAYKEGQSYENDVFKIFTPFLIMYNRHTGINYITGQGGFDDRILKMYEWNVKTMLPNGKPPTVDTGWYSSIATGIELVADMTEHSWLHWYFNEVKNQNSAYPFVIPFYNLPNKTPQQPQLRTEFIPDSGYAVFRDQWGEEGTYLLLLAEHSPDRSTHEQADQASFLLYSHKAYAAIDPGDGRAYRAETEGLFNRGGKEDWMQSGFGHNLITIDSHYTKEYDENDVMLKAGENNSCTPSLDYLYTRSHDPSYLQNMYAKEHIDYAEAYLDFTDQDVILVRSIAFPRHRYFIVADQLSAGSSHDYTWQIHFGGGTNIGSLASIDMQYSWTMPNEDDIPASLDVNFLTGPSLVTVHTDGPTNYDGHGYPRDVYDHTYLKAEAKAANHEYVTVLFPRWQDEPSLTIEELMPDTAWKIIHNPEQYDIVINNPDRKEIETDILITNASLLFACLDKNNEGFVPLTILAKGGSEITVQGEGLWQFKTDPKKIFFYQFAGVVPEYPDESGTEPEDVPLGEFSFKVVNNIISSKTSQSAGIIYTVPDPGHLFIRIYSPDGKIIKTLIDQQVEPDNYVLSWDGTDETGNPVGSGVYHVKCVFGDHTKHEKIVVIR